MLSKEGKKSRHKSKRVGKSKKSKSSVTTKSVFGVSLDVVIDRDPSHDGVLLPAFFRHCIDYIEEHGLCSKGIYRVPGVNSQVKMLIKAIDRGEPFPEIAPTSAAYHQSHRSSEAGHSRSFSIGLADLKLKTKHAQPGSMVSPSHRPTTVLPHDTAVVASVVKHFLRNLPKPLLTESLRAMMESLPTSSSQIYQSLARLVHGELPRPNRFLLAWLLQHLMHVIDQSMDNSMTLDDLSVVMSPCLGISHRLLAVLLRPAPAGIHIDLPSLDPEMPTIDPNLVPPSSLPQWHWLFPHPDYLMRPYHPPIRFSTNMDLPESETELDLEMSKQQSLLAHLHKLIGGGDLSQETKDRFFETQRLLTEMRRRKSLTDPDVIRVELNRQQAKLDQLFKALITENDTASSSTQPVVNSSGKKRRTSDKSKKHKTAPSPPPSSALSDELWALQHYVTMLKRRLKQKQGQQVDTLKNQSEVCLSPGAQIVMCGSIPLVIPSLAELDEEEVLNLTLRKLPVGVKSHPAVDHSSVPVQSHPPDERMQRPPSTSLPATELDVGRTEEEPTVRVSWEQSLNTPPASPMKTEVVEPSEQSQVEVSSVPQVTTKTTSTPTETPPKEEKQSPDTFPVKKPTLSHTERRRLHQIALCNARKQELEAIQADLQERINSEKAEIHNIESRIADLLKNGNQRVKLAYDEQMDSSLYPVPEDGKPWTRLAERLNSALAEDYAESEGSVDHSGSSSSEDGADGEDEATRHSDEESQSVAYAPLTEEGEDDNAPLLLTANPIAEDGDTQTGDDDDEEDEAEDEAELAQTLYQLILDNARLEQLNSRYLDGIQAERNRCAELKVLIKLRTPTHETPVAPESTAL